MFDINEGYDWDNDPLFQELIGMEEEEHHEAMFNVPGIGESQCRFRYVENQLTGQPELKIGMPNYIVPPIDFEKQYDPPFSAWERTLEIAMADFESPGLSSYSTKEFIRPMEVAPQYPESMEIVGGDRREKEIERKVDDMTTDNRGVLVHSLLRAIEPMLPRGRRIVFLDAYGGNVSRVRRHFPKAVYAYSEEISDATMRMLKACEGEVVDILPSDLVIDVHDNNSSTKHRLVTPYISLGWFPEVMVDFLDPNIVTVNNDHVVYYGKNEALRYYYNGARGRNVKTDEALLKWLADHDPQFNKHKGSIVGWMARSAYVIGLEETKMGIGDCDVIRAGELSHLPAYDHVVIDKRVIYERRTEVEGERVVSGIYGLVLDNMKEWIVDRLSEEPLGIRRKKLEQEYPKVYYPRESLPVGEVVTCGITWSTRGFRRFPFGRCYDRIIDEPPCECSYHKGVWEMDMGMRHVVQPEFMLRPALSPLLQQATRLSLQFDDGGMPWIVPTHSMYYFNPDKIHSKALAEFSEFVTGKVKFPYPISNFLLKGMGRLLSHGQYGSLGIACAVMDGENRMVGEIMEEGSTRPNRWLGDFFEQRGLNATDFSVYYGMVTAHYQNHTHLRAYVPRRMEVPTCLEGYTLHNVVMKIMNGMIKYEAQAISNSIGVVDILRDEGD